MDWAERVAELEAEGLTTSDAQAVADADMADPFYGADSGPMDLPDVSATDRHLTP